MFLQLLFSCSQYAVCLHKQLCYIIIKISFEDFVLFSMHLSCNQVHAAQSFLRCQQFLSQSRNSPHCMETEGSLPHSPRLVTFPYTEPDKHSECRHTVML